MIIIIKLITKYQYIFIITLSIIATIQNYKLIYTKISEEINNINKVSNNRSYNNNDEGIILSINEENDSYGINGYYELFTNKLYNDAFIFKNKDLNIWIYKIYDIIDDEKIFYWIINN